MNNKVYQTTLDLLSWLPLKNRLFLYVLILDYFVRKGKGKKRPDFSEIVDGF